MRNLQFATHWKEKHCDITSMLFMILKLIQYLENQTEYFMTCSVLLLLNRHINVVKLFTTLWAGARSLHFIHSKNNWSTNAHKILNHQASFESHHKFSMHSNGESGFLLEGTKNGHIVWKTILHTARTSGIAGTAVEETPRTLFKVSERRHEPISRSYKHKSCALLEEKTVSFPELSMDWTDNNNPNYFTKF